MSEWEARWSQEVVRWKRGHHRTAFPAFSNIARAGQAVSGEQPDEQDTRIDVPLNSADLLAVNALGQFAEHPATVATL